MCSLRSAAWRGWACILGGVLINTSCGAIYCFGNMTPYIVSYVRKYGRESNLTYQIAILCTSVVFAMNALGISLSSWVEGKLGVRRTILCGCLVNWFGTVTSFWAVQFSFYLLVVTYGIVFGLSSGLLFYPTILSGMRWFPNKRGLVVGILMSFFGIGAILFDFTQTLFINPSNLNPDDIEVVGERQEIYYTQESVLMRTPDAFLLQAGISAIVQITGLLLLYEAEEYHRDIEMQSLLDNDKKGPSSIWDDSIEKESSLDTMKSEHIEHVEDNHCARNTPLTSDADESGRGGRDRTPTSTNHQGVVAGEGLESSRRDPRWSGLSLRVGQVTRSPAIWQFLAMNAACSFTGVAFVGSYKTFGLGFIRDDLFLAGTGSIASVSNGLGHFVAGFLTDHISIKVISILLSALMSFLLLVISATSLGGKVPFLIVVCAVFFMLGGIYAIQPVFAIRAYGEAHFAGNYSLILILGSCVPNILGTLMVFIQPFLSWTTMYICFGILSGISMIAGMFMNVKNQQGNDV